MCDESIRTQTLPLDLFSGGVFILTILQHAVDILLSILNKMQFIFVDVCEFLLNIRKCALCMLVD